MKVVIGLSRKVSTIVAAAVGVATFLLLFFTPLGPFLSTGIVGWYVDLLFAVVFTVFAKREYNERGAEGFWFWFCLVLVVLNWGDVIFGSFPHS